MNKKTIFDLGMHRGLDTEFYLSKGFRVVALEANPELAKICAERLSSYVDSGDLTIINKALSDGSGDSISFFLNDDKDDWSSVSADWASKGGHALREITVPTTNLSEMVREYGAPYYIKCDIEGADHWFAEQLVELEETPEFISVEAISLSILAFIRAAKYQEFQLINQWLNPLVEPPNPPLEGEYVKVKFNGHMSGLFGLELPNTWKTFEAVCEEWLDFRSLQRRNEGLTWGWCDFHARKSGKSPST